MSTSLLPMWLRVGWAVALGAVTLVHIWHAGARPGQTRWWHAGHALMALGMMAMYLLGRTAHPGLSRLGVMLFGACSAALAVTALVVRRRDGVLNRLWVAAAADTLAMTYMLAPTHAAVVSLVLLVYLFCQTLAWALGLWTRTVVPLPTPASAAIASEPAAASSAAVAVTSPAAANRAVGLAVHDGPAVRISLAVMAAAMAYMLAAM
jgi:hypothetical protein